MSTTGVPGGGHDEGEGEVVELLQQMIRNACVNDGSASSGGEARSADVLAGLLEPFAGVERYETAPGRASLVARLEGTDPSAPTLLYLGHTDVVPANPAAWRHDPFGGELIDGEVWGRGAVDMLNLTAAMAVAFRRLTASGFRPRGSLVYAAVADEEASGTYGAGWLASHELDAVRADYAITESGGIPIVTPAGTRLPVIVGEKGCYWCTLRVHGTAGHASTPLRTDNALVTAAEVVRRIAQFQPPAVIGDSWRRLVDGLGLPTEISAMLLDPQQVDGVLESLPEVGFARQAHATTHTTFAPTVMHGGTKTNVIPDSVDLQLDIRTLPGQTGDEVAAMLREALGDLVDRVDVTATNDDPASESAVDTPLWDLLSRVSERYHAGSRTVPVVSVGATDARFFRRLGTVAYGYGMFSRRMDFEQFTSMFHGADERVDVESLALSVDLFETVARELLA
jgi:acetylornithine deacetylase/succinyl-diaminopimelate desuccinylase-like protein